MHADHKRNTLEVNSNIRVYGASGAVHALQLIILWNLGIRGRSFECIEYMYTHTQCKDQASLDRRSERHRTRTSRVPEI